MAETRLITLTDPRSAAAEAFRSLRANLLLRHTDRALTTIMITSPSTPDDKSLLAANLAVTLAQAGHSTILVDADLRTPMQHTLWGVDNTRGLGTMMADDSALSTPPLMQTSVPNLLLLPSGPVPGAPADLLSSPRLNEVIGVLKARAHYILFDCAPVLGVSDASLLGSRTDAALLVVRAGHTRREHTLRASQQLEQVHAHLLGVVLSNS